jgi:hypothetical protein
MFNYRIYKTNLQYCKETIEELMKALTSNMSEQTKLATFTFRKLTIQLFGDGTLRIHGGHIDDDLEVLSMIAKLDTVTIDGRPFCYQLRSIHPSLDDLKAVIVDDLLPSMPESERQKVLPKVYRMGSPIAYWGKNINL